MMNSYEDRRNTLQQIFQDTMQWTEKDAQLADATFAMKTATKVYLQEIGIEGSAEKNKRTDILVVEDTTFNCARKMVSQGKVAALNFANPVNPGGGVERGAAAQEECLCRSSNLYAGLISPQMLNFYYRRHRNNCNETGSDSVGYHPGVTVFKSDDLFPHILNKSDWFQLDVITCAAPIIRPWSRISDEDLYRIHVTRGRRIIEAAAANKAEILILGAFGCGAFHNNPDIVAKAYRYLLLEEGYAGFFKQVVFAIKKDHNDVNGNFYHFDKVFQKKI